MHRARKDRQICECLHVKLHKLSSGHDICFIVAKEEKETFFFPCVLIFSFLLLKCCSFIVKP